MNIKTNHLMRNDKSLMIACDQGLEHGPTDFNLKNVDPNYILDIALEGRYNAVILQSGISEKYYHEAYRDVPLVVKLNGKTNLGHGCPVSKQICSVDRAMKIGAAAVGYTVYPGSETEADGFAEFGKIVEQAHDYGIPAILWSYPRGQAIRNDLTTEVLSHAARIGLELGADFVKLKYNQDIEAYKWVVKNAGRARVLTAGGSKVDSHDFVKSAEGIMKTGATGIAVGRNIWQSAKPFALTHALREIIFRNKKASEVLPYLDNEKK
ncbi:fructose-bisphosphate aldolase [Candidatus Woesearchaeota archaeon]|nr:fructose-bisphosphate aldolase [Candidatus Woesearchaeota archaeon]